MVVENPLLGNTLHRKSKRGLNCKQVDKHPIKNAAGKVVSYSIPM
jgi:hypothetical protein